jgi:predicted phage tail protein
VPDDEPITIAEIVRSNGADDAIWCLKAVVGYDIEKKLFALWCARQVQHIGKHTTKNKLDAAEIQLTGTVVTTNTLPVAASAASAAYDAASSAAAYAAAYDAVAASAASAASAAYDAYDAVAYAAAAVSIKDAQAAQLVLVCNQTEQQVQL